MFAVIYSCSDHLDIKPQGSLSEDVIVYNQDWLEKQLVAAYGSLDGYIDRNGGNNAWRAPGSNWTFGDIPTDDAYKGSDAADQAEMNEMEWFTYDASNGYMDSKWKSIYEGVNRCNQVMKALAIASEEGLVPQDVLSRIEGEARFLRAMYHMDALKNFKFIPYIDETVTESQSNMTGDAYSRVDQDLNTAITLLPPTQAETGRANAWTARAMLAKSKMFQGDHPAATSLLDNIIANGPYSLVANFHENFNAEYGNSSESVFAIQNSVNDGAPDSANGNWGNILAFTHNSSAPVTCCGFFQPSQNLVNAFRVDAVNGLPLFDTFNDTDFLNDQGLLSSDAFTPDGTTPLDPRMDWTVGRRGIEFLGWGPHPGQDWIRDQVNGGPYSQKKAMFTAAQNGSLSTTSGWTNGPNAINTNIIRYADILLWRAEIMAEAGTGDMGMALVNQVRERAMTGSKVQVNTDGTGGDAANYAIGLYTPATYTDPVNMVRWERRLELAMEGHRLYDLVRWGVAADVINTYITKEKTLRAYLNGKTFAAGKNEYYAIPQPQIDASGDVMEQNPAH